MYILLQVNKAHMAFLSPPVSTCINPACNGVGTLRLNHHDIDVVIFDMKGPNPATKLSLKCTSCAMIYNYSKYGNKNQGGEKFYESEREYIEVTDVVYVSRNLYSLYRSLWYVYMITNTYITMQNFVDYCTYIHVHIAS